jgi:hypothetical protein
VLNFMAVEEAKRLGIGEDDRRLHIRVSNGKANMGPLGKASWFKLEVENLPNGDEIACASPWNPPNPFNDVEITDAHKCRALAQTGAYRLDARSPEWIGYAIAEVLQINVSYGAENAPKDLARIKRVLAMWLKNKVLKTVTREDKGRKKRTFVIPGDWNEGAPIDPDARNKELAQD